MVNLTELEFDECLNIFETTEHRQIDIHCFKSLTSLKVLKLNFHSFSITPLMENLAANEIPIEYLEIRFGFFDSQSIKAISKSKQIKIQKIDNFVIELAKELLQLKKLRLKQIFDDFNLSITGITKLISHANRLSLLEINATNKIKIEEKNYNAMLN